jgi:GMP synthase-like glutamine amidotransferase
MTSMRVHYLQHVPFEGLGAIEPWLEAAGHEISHTKMFADETLPDASHVDWLIIMGGPMGANDDSKFRWLRPEKRLIRESISLGKPVLGICLGAQLIASVLGAKVYKNLHREIGWFEIERCAEASGHPLGKLFPVRSEVFHWHADTFDLPASAVQLARSAACQNQAFAYSTNVLGLQFHLEMTAPMIADWAEKGGDDLTPGPYTQTPEQMLARPERLEKTNEFIVRLLSAMSK